MIKDVVSYLDYSTFQEIALAIFVTVFVAVTFRTLFIQRSKTDRMAMIPLDEGHKEPKE